MYDNMVNMKNIHAITSARPVSPATASVWIGCVANNNPDRNVLMLHGNKCRPRFTTNPVARQCKSTFTRWYPKAFVPPNM